MSNLIVREKYVCPYICFFTSVCTPTYFSLCLNLFFFSTLQAHIINKLNLYINTYDTIYGTNMLVGKDTDHVTSSSDE